VLNNDACKAATGSADFSARLWDACSGEQVHEFKHNHIVRAVNFNQSSTKLATGGMEKVVRVFDINSPSSEPATLAPGPSGVRNLTWIQGDNLLCCTHVDTPGISVYDMRSHELVKTLATDTPTNIEVTYCGSFITAADSSSVHVFNSSTLEQVAHMAVPYTVETASFWPSTRRLVTGATDMWVRLHDLDSGAELEVNKGHHGPVHTVSFAPTGDAYASGSEDGTIRIWFVDNDGGSSAAENGHD
jgi:serine-threonine kinase receptor-associated protein